MALFLQEFDFKKNANSVCGGVAFVMRFFFILFGHVKDRINSNGRQNGIFG